MCVFIECNMCCIVQIIKGKRYTFSVDFWSYGVLCYEMITGQVQYWQSCLYMHVHVAIGLQSQFFFYCLCCFIFQSPFGGEDEEELFDSICNSKIPFSRFLENSTIDYLDKLLQRDPAERLGCIEDRQPIRKHPFFKSIDFARLERREIPPPYKPSVVSYTPPPTTNSETGKFWWNFCCFEALSLTAHNLS